MRGRRSTMRPGRIVDLVVGGRRTRELLGHDGWTVDQLRAHQQARLDELVRYAAARSPYYRSLYAGMDLSGPVTLEQLPSVSKDAIMRHFDDVLTDPRLRQADLVRVLGRDQLYKRRFRVLSTSGATGGGGIFVISADEWRIHLAGLLRVNEYIGLRPRVPRRRRVATIVSGHAMHVTGQMSRGLDVGLYNLLRLDATTPVESMVAPLNRHQPEFLYGYPSILELLAAEQQAGRLRIAPSTLVSCGEAHTVQTVGAIRAIWDVPWFNLYGATEAPVLAAQCPAHTGLHLFEDLAIVEVVDEHDQPVPAGRRGHRVLLTNLVNRTQPLIRYQLSDLVTLAAEPCPCGRPFRLLRAVDGRNDDILVMRDVPVSPGVFRNALAAIPGLRQYRIHHRQRGSTRLTVEAALDYTATAKQVRDAITTALATAGVTGAHIEVHVVDSISIADARDNAGKLRTIIGSQFYEGFTEPP
jgi:phenylacetate-CoA ligase